MSTATSPRSLPSLSSVDMLRWSEFGSKQQHYWVRPVPKFSYIVSENWVCYIHSPKSVYCTYLCCMRFQWIATSHNLFCSMKSLYCSFQFKIRPLASLALHSESIWHRFRHFCRHTGFQMWQHWPCRHKSRRYAKKTYSTKACLNTLHLGPAYSPRCCRPYAKHKCSHLLRTEYCHDISTSSAYRSVTITNWKLLRD